MGGRVTKQLERTPGDDRCGAGQVVLIFDRNPAGRALSERILRDAGFDVRVVSQVPQAVQLVREVSPLMVVTVDQLDAAGIELCRQLKQSARPSLPLLLLAKCPGERQHAAAETAQSNLGQASGFSGRPDAAGNSLGDHPANPWSDVCLRQPLQPQQLVATVRLLARTARAEQQAQTLQWRLQRAWDAVADGLCWVNPDGEIVHCNRAAARILGQPKRSLCGQLVDKVIRGAQQLADPAAGPTARPVPQRMQGQTEDRWFNITWRPAIDSQGHCGGHVYVLSEMRGRGGMQQAEAIVGDANQGREERTPRRPSKREPRAPAAGRRQTDFQRIDQLERELRHLEQRTNLLPRVTAQLFGGTSFRESLPDVFRDLVARYGELLELALEQREYRVSHDISEGLRQLSDRMGFLKAGARDIIQVHSAALQARQLGATARKAQAYLQESRIMVLELMGHLVSYYRMYAVGFRRVAGQDSVHSAEAKENERG